MIVPDFASRCPVLAHYIAMIRGAPLLIAGTLVVLGLMILIGVAVAAAILYAVYWLVFFF